MKSFIVALLFAFGALVDAQTVPRLSERPDLVPLPVPPKPAPPPSVKQKNVELPKLLRAQTEVLRDLSERLTAVETRLRKIEEKSKK